MKGSQVRKKVDFQLSEEAKGGDVHGPTPGREQSSCDVSINNHRGLALKDNTALPLRTTLHSSII